MPWQVYVLILNSVGYPIKGKYTQGNLNSIRNELRDTIANDGRYNDEIAAWIADGSLESRYYVDDNGQLPTFLLPVAERNKIVMGEGGIFEGVIEWDDVLYPYICYPHWEDKIANYEVEQHTVLFVLTSGVIDPDEFGWEEV